MGLSVYNWLDVVILQRNFKIIKPDFQKINWRISIPNKIILIIYYLSSIIISGIFLHMF